MISVDEQIYIIEEGTEEIVNVDDLRKKLEKFQKTGIPLRVKLALDATEPDIHLGHAVLLRKIKQFQDMGHKAVIVLENSSATIVNLSNKAGTEKQLNCEELSRIAETIEKQIYKILDRKKTEIKFSPEENIDVEIVGIDQRPDFLTGRKHQSDSDRENQVTVFMPVLEGTDGIEKMSKSLGNYIGISEEAESMYRKAMSIPGSLVLKYFELATGILPGELELMKELLESGNVNPLFIKMRLAWEITALYHGRESAALAEEHFKKELRKSEMPGVIEEYDISGSMPGSGEVDVVKL